MMKTQYKQLSKIQRFALYMHNKVDKTGAFYRAFDSFPQRARFFFYTIWVLLSVGFIFILWDFANEVISTFQAAYYEPLMITITLLLMVASFYLTTPLFFETLIEKVDMASVQKDVSNIKDKNKTEKKEWWRTRNWRMPVRILFYGTIFFIFTQFGYYYTIGQIYTLANEFIIEASALNATITNIDAFREIEKIQMEAFNEFIKYAFVFFLVVCLLLELRIKKIKNN